MKATTLLGLLMFVNFGTQAVAGELGNSRGINETSHQLGTSKLGSFQWIQGLCYKVGFPKSELLQNSEKAKESCAKLRDYSEVDMAYKKWAADAKHYTPSIPEHASGSICKTEHTWYWATKAGSAGTACKVYLPDNTFVFGVRI